MAKGINIGIASDTRQFLQGVKNGVIEPLDGVADVLEDVVKAGDKAGDQLTDTFRDQQQETDKLQKHIRDLNQEIKDGGSSSSRSFSDSNRKAAKETTEGFDEIKESSRSNATEVAASFDGSAQSISDGFQGLAAEVFAGFGPAGVVAGVAAAAGIGLISTAMQNGQEDTDAFKQDVADLADDLIETGNKGSASMSKIVSSLQDLATGSDEAGVTLSKLSDIADQSGSSYKDLAQAYAGNGRGLDALVKKSADRLAQLREEQSQNNRVGSTYARAASQLDKQTDAQGRYVDYLKQAQKQQKAAAEEQRDYLRSGAADLDKAAAAAQAYADGIQQSTQDAGGSWEDYTKNGVTNLDKYNAALEKNFQATQDYATNVKAVSSKLSSDALEYIESLGPSAAPLLQSFVDAPLAEQDRTAKNWDKIGKQSSDSFNASLQKNLPKSVEGPKVRVGVDRSELDSFINSAAFQRGLKLPVSLIPTTVGSGVKRNP